jgi:hypothetical protein
MTVPTPGPLGGPGHPPPPGVTPALTAQWPMTGGGFAQTGRASQTSTVSLCVSTRHFDLTDKEI